MADAARTPARRGDPAGSAGAGRAADHGAAQCQRLPDRRVGYRLPDARLWPHPPDGAGAVRPRRLSGCLHRRLERRHEPRTVPGRHPHRRGGVPPLHPPVGLAGLAVRQGQPSAAAPAARRSGAGGRPLLAEQHAVLRGGAACGAGRVGRIRPAGGSVRVCVGAAGPLAAARHEGPVLVPLDLAAAAAGGALALPLHPRARQNAPRVLAAGGRRLHGALHVRV